MAHNIWKDSNGRNNMFCVGAREAAWHKLGQRTEGAVSWVEAMKLAGLDWTVNKEELYLPVNGNFVAVPAWGIVRSSDGAYLGTVGAHYQTIQNEYAFDFMDALQ